MKRKYYVVEQYERKGPYNIGELKNYGITKDSLIWAFEFNEPKKAGDIEELNEIFTLKITPENTEKEKEKEKLSDKELLKQYEELKKEADEKKEEIKQDEDKTNEQENIDEIKEESEPVIIIPPVDNNEDKTKINEVIKDDISDNFTEKNTNEIDEIILDNQTHNEPEDLTFDSDNKLIEITPVTKNTENNFKDKTDYNKEYESTVGPKDKPEKPKNYVIWGILLTIFCCNPLAIASIITGAQVEKKYNDGDFAGARKASQTTQILLIVSVVLSVIGLIAVLVADA